MLSLKEVKEAKEELKRIEKSQDEFNKSIQEEKREINKKFDKLIWDLKDKLNEEIIRVNKDEDEINEKYEANKENSLCILEEFKENIKFYKIFEEKKNYAIKTPEVYYYGYIRTDKMYIEGEKQKFFYNPIGILVEDDFKKILVYITKNRKPKNCYDLIVCGNTRLTGDLLNIPYSYGIGVRIDNSNIREVVKSFEKEEEAKSYFKRNKNRILKEFLENHKKIEERYSEFVKELEDDKVKREWIIAYLEEQKDYYENHYYNGKEEEEYKQIIKQIEDLNGKS